MEATTEKPGNGINTMPPEAVIDVQPAAQNPPVAPAPAQAPSEGPSAPEAQEAAPKKVTRTELNELRYFESERGRLLAETKLALETIAKQETEVYRELSAKYAVDLSSGAFGINAEGIIGKVQSQEQRAGQAVS